MSARGREDARAQTESGGVLSGRSADEKPPPSSLSPRSDADRRSFERLEVTWSVDCETEDTFLYAAITNISEMGIFVRTLEPLAIGTELILRFAPPRSREPFVLRGTVQWVNPLDAVRDCPNPGMGILFIDLSLEDRERLVDAIRTIAYLRDDPTPQN